MSRKELEFCTPEFMLSELAEHYDEIVEKTHRNHTELLLLIEEIKQNVTFIAMDELVPYYDIAKKIISDPDDIAYVALAIKLSIPIWSNDKKMKQSVVKVYNTAELESFCT
jgi:predicted nucleic acid-binding protein